VLTRYYPTPLEVMETPWIQWWWCCRATSRPRVRRRARAGRQGDRKALGLETGFTHMEWFRRDDGSLAIGEIAARPPGAHIVLATATRTTPTCTGPGPGPSSTTPSTARSSASTRSAPPSCAASAAAGWSACAASRRPTRKVGHIAVESKLPQGRRAALRQLRRRRLRVVRHPDVEQVKRAMTTIIETIQIEYA
jgi:hypothetical protein